MYLWNHEARELVEGFYRGFEVLNSGKTNFVAMPELKHSRVNDSRIQILQNE